MAVVKKNVVRLQSASKSWGSKSKRERAVAVARDVLALLNARKIKVGHAYLKVKSQTLADDADMRSVLMKRRCEVCAKGAIFVARTLGRNEVTAEQAGLTSSCYFTGLCYGDGDAMCDTLRDCFGRGDLDVIERAYENNFSDFEKNYGKWQKEYPDDKERLRAIMQRVIENKGRFTERDYAHP